MGRRITKRNVPKDRIGEVVDMKKCPRCYEHDDCFASLNGMCTALSVCGGADCPFYKPTEQAMAENKAAYASLKDRHRYDLIRKYGKQLSALGAMDDEIAETDRLAAESDPYAVCDFKELMEEVY